MIFTFCVFFLKFEFAFPRRLSRYAYICYIDSGVVGYRMKNTENKHSFQVTDNQFRYSTR
eukprot:UN33576